VGKKTGIPTDYLYLSVQPLLSLVVLKTYQMLKLFATDISKFTRWLEARKAGLPWVTLLKESKLLVGFIMKVVVLLVAGKKSSTFNGAAIAFAKNVVRMYKKTGALGAQKYLSKCQLLLMQSISNSESLPPCLPTSPRVATTKTGLPRMIPKEHRKMIRKGDQVIIQLWLTLFALHRVFTLKGVWKLHTIYKGNVCRRATDGGLYVLGNASINPPLHSADSRISCLP
jgi:hypothetical protein